jgi:hypothetical protein
MAAKPQPFIFRWQKAVRDADMPVGRKGFALILSTWADADGTSCYPAIATLAAKGYGKRSVYRYLGDLEDCGWLCVEHGGGRLSATRYANNRYTLTLPSGYSDVTANSEEPVLSCHEAGAEVSQSGCSPDTERCHESTTTYPPTSPSTNPKTATTSTATEEEHDLDASSTLAQKRSDLRAAADAAGVEVENVRYLAFALTGKRLGAMNPTEIEQVAAELPRYAAEWAAPREAR